MKYDPSTKEVSVVIDGFYFANGIALSKDEDYVIVCESWKFRCRKYWLEGEKKGQLEIFIDNLPGGPDNINIAPDGNFWISLIKMNATGVQALHNCSDNKILLAAYPELIGLLIPMGITAPATAVKVTTDGEIIMEYSDPNATYISFVTSSLEYEGNLYMASTNANFLRKLPLDSNGKLPFNSKLYSLV
ncbi:SMP-30/gluconolactonase/LRE family protein, partial [Klebsiella pneumoniae]|uniref:SMP-30/gluconolactonase/LRE family protein n=1 Tax=Klebsiella pneumoniae TaxID=573 RepID=UPI00379DB9CA